eukprot:TCALIF_06833-PA protein Name:"Protein of unknown function" AED:0.06 eAED:0.06 QI:0/0/0/0.6/1/1/5/0/1037
MKMSGRWQVVMVFLYLWVEGSWHCRISEYRCKTVPQCIRLDQVCDRVAHCSDASDELDGCSVCNKTYHGDVGKTYRLSVSQPPLDQLPFTCRMRFSAAHYELGDIVKLTLEKFRIGHFQSPLHNGCPDGALKISDGNRFHGGQYCGSVNQFQMKPIYISETTSLTAELKLMRISSSKRTLGGDFAFDIAYQFLSKSDAMIRHQKNTDTGILRAQKGVSCSYEFSNCLLKECHLQSPNYPGMYPRNLTCSYHVNVKRDEIPPGHFASITLYQEPQHKSDWLPSPVGGGSDSSGTRPGCEMPGDQITIYDGSHPNDPVLAQLCLNREIPIVTSSGSSILLVFRSVPFAVPNMGALTTRGFEIRVKVQVRPFDSFSPPGSTRRNRQQKLPRKFQLEACHFQIDSDNGSKGTLGSASHSLPANSSCQYNFVGKPHERVWITFTRFSSPSTHGLRNGPLEACASNHLVLIDSDQEIGKFCHSNPPKLCEHTLLSSEYWNQTLAPFRPCHIQTESYVSKSGTFSIVQVMEQGSVIEPVEFSLHFEFVQETSAQKKLFSSSATSLSLTTLEDSRNQSCHYVFLGSKLKSKSVYSIPSPGNVFLFGRGGAPNLTCTYEFIGAPGQAVMLLLKEMAEAPSGLESSCHQIANPLMSQRSACQMGGNYAAPDAPGSYLVVGDQFKPNSLFDRSECFCAEAIDSHSPRRIISNSSSLRLEYHIRNMKSIHDFTHFHFKAQFVFIQQDQCSSAKIMQDTGGQIVLDVSDPCHHNPWTFDFGQLEGAQMFMKCQGHLVGTYDHVVIFQDPKNLTSVKGCTSANKIIIRSKATTYVVCPVVHPAGSGISSVDVILPPQAVVQLISDGEKGANSQDVGIYQIRWLLLFPQSSLTNNVQSNTTSPSLDPSLGLVSRSSDAGQMSSACAFACPELLSAGCIDASLWCDGIAHCPSGFDESEDNCRHVFGPILFTYCLSAFIILLLVLIGFVIVQRCRHLQQQNAISHLQNPFTSSSAQIISGDIRTQCHDNLKPNSHNSITNLTQDYLVCAQGIS